MSFTRIGVVLIVLLLAATSFVLMREESGNPRARAQVSSRLQTADGTKGGQSERTVQLRPGGSIVVAAGQPTRVTCEAPGLSETVPADATVWVCDCEPGDESVETVYLIRKLITTAGHIVHRTVLERFVSEFTFEYKLSACLDALRVSRLCR